MLRRGEGLVHGILSKGFVRNLGGPVPSSTQVGIAIIDAEIVLEALAGEYFLGGQPFLDDELQIPGIVIP
jgi:hypothetical protein